jgi:hypothetical protein
LKCILEIEREISSYYTLIHLIPLQSTPIQDYPNKPAAVFRACPLSPYHTSVFSSSSGLVDITSFPIRQARPAAAEGWVAAQKPTTKTVPAARPSRARPSEPQLRFRYARLLLPLTLSLSPTHSPSHLSSSINYRRSLPC